MENEIFELYNIADTIAKNIIKDEPDIKKAVKLARETINKDVLKRFVIIGNLNNEQISLLNSKTSEVKFSLDNVIKNKINHPELIFDDYKNINEIISNPDEIKLSKNKHNSILLLKKYNKMYQIVIKTTLKFDENFITSFRFAEH